LDFYEEDKNGHDIMNRGCRPQIDVKLASITWFSTTKLDYGEAQKSVSRVFIKKFDKNKQTMEEEE